MTALVGVAHADRLQGLASLLHPDIRVLVLGSFPSVKS